MGGKIFGEEKWADLLMLFLVVVCENQLTAAVEFIIGLVFNATAPDIFLLSAQYLELQHFERKIFMFPHDSWWLQQL